MALLPSLAHRGGSPRHPDYVQLLFCAVDAAELVEQALAQKGRSPRGFLPSGLNAMASLVGGQVLATLLPLQSTDPCGVAELNVNVSRPIV